MGDWCLACGGDGGWQFSGRQMWVVGSVMVSSPLLPAFGTLSHLLYFRLPSTFLPSKGRSITTIGTRWHDFFLFFITLFRYFIKLFYSFHYIYFPFLKGCRLEKGHIVPVLCSHSLKKKNASRNPSVPVFPLPIGLFVFLPYFSYLFIPLISHNNDTHVPTAWWWELLVFIAPSGWLLISPIKCFLTCLLGCLRAG